MSVCSAFLLYLSFPNVIHPFGFWPLAWIFALPLFWSLENGPYREKIFPRGQPKNFRSWIKTNREKIFSGHSRLNHFKVGVLFGWAAFALLWNWILELNVMGFLALVGLFALQPILFCLFFRTQILPWPARERRGWKEYFFFVGVWIADLFYPGALWVVTEFFRSWYLGGFSWTIGYSQEFFPFSVQIADRTGSYGISFVLITFNYCLFRALNLRWKEHAVPASAGRRVLPYFYATAALALLTVLSFDAVHSLTRSFGESPPHFYKICCIQPNIDPQVKWQKELLSEVIAQHIHLTQMCLKTERPDLVVWPETAIPDDFLKDFELRERVGAITQQIGTHLLVGAAIKEAGHYYNSAVLLNKRSVVLNIYRKRNLIPFSEYAPQVKFFPFFRQIFAFKGIGFHSGTGLGIFSIRQQRVILRKDLLIKLAVGICSESLYPQLWRSLTQQGAEVGIVMINDAWFKRPEALLLHAQGAIMRAVENRLWIVQATNSGWTFAVDPHGWIDSKEHNGLGLNEAGFAVFTPYVTQSQTFYQQTGDIFAFFCGGFVIMNWFIFFFDRST